MKMLGDLSNPYRSIRDRKGPTDWTAAYNSHLKLSGNWINKTVLYLINKPLMAI